MEVLERLVDRAGGGDRCVLQPVAVNPAARAHAGGGQGGAQASAVGLGCHVPEAQGGASLAPRSCSGLAARSSSGIVLLQSLVLFDTEVGSNGLHHLSSLP